MYPFFSGVGEMTFVSTDRSLANTSFMYLSDNKGIICNDVQDDTAIQRLIRTHTQHT